MTTELLDRPPVTEIAEYSPTAAALAGLRARLSNVAYDVTTGKGLDIAKKDRAEVRDLRVALEKKRVELKAPALERSRLIDAEAKALTAELVALEKPIDDQIKAEERRKEAEKAAREEQAREEAAFIQGQFDTMRENIAFCAGQSAQTIRNVISDFTGLQITLEVFGDRTGEAQQAKTETLARLEVMHAAAAAHEAEVARMATEREELARQRAEQEAREKAERERVAAEQAEQAAKLAAERKAFEQEQAKARAEVQDREDADRARRDEEDRKAREARAAEDERISRERAALEAQQRAVREAEEAKELKERMAAAVEADTAAAAERKRLDDEAAAQRAEQQRMAKKAAKAAAKLAAAQKAGPRLLAALSALLHECTQDGVSERIDRAVSEEAYAACDEAEGGAA